MEPLYIPSRAKDSLIIRFGFCSLFLLFLCSGLYISVEKEGISIGTVALVGFIVVLIWYMERRFQQLRYYSVNGIIIDEKGITFGSSFYNKATVVQWEMIRGFTITKMQVKLSSIPFLMIMLTNPKDFYNKSRAKVLFADDTSFYASLQDVNIDSNELMEKITNYRNKLTEIKDNFSMTTN